MVFYVFVLHPRGERGGDEDMVERAPVPTITIRGLGTVSALRTNADMYEMLGEQLHHIAIRLIVHIAHHQYQRVGMKSLELSLIL